jgi:hypothetical protein
MRLLNPKSREVPFVIQGRFDLKAPLLFAIAIHGFVLFSWSDIPLLSFSAPSVNGWS